MRLSVGYLRTRVARRVLLLFFVGALVPVLFMASASFRAMNRQLLDQSDERLRQMSRNARQAVMQQLLLTESGIRLAAEALRSGREVAETPIPTSIRGLSLGSGGGAPVPLVGDGFEVPDLTPAESDHLAGGAMLLRLDPGADIPVLMALRPAGNGDQVLWADVEGDSIWAAAERFASGGAIRDFCVLAGSVPLYCRSGVGAAASAFASDTSDPPPPSGSVRLTSADGPLVVGHAELFLQAAFGAPPVRVLVAEGVDDLYSADLSLFRYSFGVALALGVLLVLLLASIQIRRTMTPLQALTEGTRRLADGDLDARVAVDSGDEFGVLAHSFNSMAGRLGIQFRTLEAGRAIDRAVLSAMDVDGVVTALLAHFDALVSCRSLAVLVVRAHGHPAVLWWKRSGGTENRREEVVVSLADRRWLDDPSGHRIVDEGSDRPTFLLDAPGALGPGPVVMLPLRTQDELLGAVLFEAEGDRAPSADLVNHGRHVADQASVALDAVRLLGELEEMSWGTLRALARAIDAKSRWTAGHSERVTAMSLRLGRIVGLSDAELSTLERGGLLHDIGKIGVPARVLDAPGPLTREEWELVREHPTIGGRILEPIRAFAPALPIVLQHHERWDGRGYPSGRAGTQIHPLARILTVADTFDAMASARPYRAALPEAVVLDEIRRCSGTQLEPRLAEAFLDMMATEAAEGIAPTEERHG